jgi:hypothetical protein
VTGTSIALSATATAAQAICVPYDYDIINRDELELLSAINRGLRADQPFTIVIQFLNTGDCTWPELTNLRFQIGSGENFGTNPRIFIREPVEPGARRYAARFIREPGHWKPRWGKLLGCR